MDNELMLYDRLAVIRDTIAKYGEENFYISYSGGKDSVVVHTLVDMALPENQIPRVYANTGIEYNKIVEFVKKQQEQDPRIVIIQPKVKIKATLEKYGYPFKSKAYSAWYKAFQTNPGRFWKVREEIENKPELLNDYDYIHNLPRGVKWTVKEYYGKRERERNMYEYSGCP